MKILILNICRESLHYLEFVKPIEDILNKNKIEFVTKNYLEGASKEILEFDKIIICGTSLKDNLFLENLEKFGWIKDIDKPLLGICAGMQIISLIHGADLKKQTEIGYFKENFNSEFLGLFGEQEVYHLHNNYASLPKDFETFTESQIPQTIKHKEKNIFGTLFHPEVRNKEVILNFARLNLN